MACIRPTVDNNSVPRIGVSPLPSEVSGQAVNSAYHGIMLLTKAVHVAYMGNGHDKKVHRRLRRNIMESYKLVILVHYLCRYLSRSDSAEQAICHMVTPLAHMQHLAIIRRHLEHILLPHE